MRSRVYRATLFGLYQLCIVLGIAVMPLAIVARQAGLSLPIHRLLESVEGAYEATESRSE